MAILNDSKIRIMAHLLTLRVIKRINDRLQWIYDNRIRTAICFPIHLRFIDHANQNALIVCVINRNESRISAFQYYLIFLNAPSVP